MRDTADDAALLRAAAFVVRLRELPGAYGRQGWREVARSLDRMAELVTGGATSDRPQDQLDRALADVCEHPGGTSGEISRRIEVSPDPTKSLLVELERRGLVTREKGQGETRWYPARIFRQPGGEEG